MSVAYFFVLYKHLANSILASTTGRRGAGGGMQGGASASTTITKKELLKHKDIKVRKWTCKPLAFHTLGGGLVEVPNWSTGTIIRY